MSVNPKIKITFFIFAVFLLNSCTKSTSDQTIKSGIFSYEIENGNLELNYTGTDKPELKIGFFTNDWIWITGVDFTYSKEISLNIFDTIYLPLWKKFETRPETQDVIIQVSYKNKFESDGKRKFIYECIKTKFDADIEQNKYVLDSNDYASKKIVPKEMDFKNESAKTAVENMKMGWNLSNHFDVFSLQYLPSGKDLPPVLWESFWGGKETTHDQIKYMKSLGFTAVRIPVTWMQHLNINIKDFDKEKNNDVKILPGWMNRIQEVVDWCLSEGFYVILNTHHDSGANEDNWLFATEESFEKYSELYKNIWEQISERFNSYSEKLIFANANEVCEVAGSWSAKTDESHKVMLKWNQLFVDTVRASGGNNLKRNISVSGLMTDGTESVLSKTILPKDSVNNNSTEHLIFEIHCYEPWNFCGDGDNFADSPYTMHTFAETKFIAERTFGTVYEFAHKNDVPVIIGEWGVLDADGKIIADEEKAKYAEVYVSEATKRGFALFNWGAQWYFGYNSIKDAKNPNPLYLKAIQENICDTEPYKTFEPDFILNGADIKKSILSSGNAANGDSSEINFEKNYDYVDGKKQETYQTYRAMIDVTESLKQQKNRLPEFGESIKISFTGTVDKDIKNLTIFLLDNSKEAGWWLDICGYNNRIYLKNVSAEVPLNVDTTLFVSTPPKEKIILRLEYSKSDFDFETNASIK